MREHLTREALIARREQLLARSAQLRAGLMLQAGTVRRPLAWADRARDGWRWVQDHRDWVLGGAALVVALRPGRTLTLAGRALAMWQFWQRTRPMWMRLLHTIERRL